MLFGNWLNTGDKNKTKQNNNNNNKKNIKLFQAFELAYKCI